MQTVISKDGTKIAYEKVGQGPALVLVDGALCYRDFGPSRSLAKQLQDDFTVYMYDRRGRGNSGNAKPYALDREIEDLAAVIEAAGGSAYVFGQSSGGVLALEAANRIPTTVTKLAVYETPLFVDATHSPLPADFIERVNGYVQVGNPGKAVKMFMRLVGTPAIFVALMPLMPIWKKLTAVAPTLAYDFTFMEQYQQGRPLLANNWSRATMSTLAAVGSKSPVWMQHAISEVAKVLPQARYSVLQGQNHMVKAEVLAPILREFFGDHAKSAPVVAQEKLTARNA